MNRKGMSKVIAVIAAIVIVVGTASAYFFVLQPAFRRPNTSSNREKIALTRRRPLDYSQGASRHILLKHSAGPFRDGKGLCAMAVKTA